MIVLESRIRQIKDQVDAGDYRVDAELVAEAILDRVLDGLDFERNCTIRALAYHGASQEEIADEVGLSQARVWAILNGQQRRVTYGSAAA